MFTRNRLLALAGLAFLPLGAQAAGTASSFGVGTRLGPTTGLGLEATYGVNRWIDLRGAFHVGTLSFDYDDDDTTYEAEFSYRAAAGFVDLKPFGGGFRITAGIYSKPMELELSASGQDDYDVGDRTYRGDLDLDGEVDLGSSAPYLGIGWGGTTNGSGFGASFDIGVQFADAPNVSLDARGTACDATLDSGCDPNGVEGFNVNSADPRAQIFQAELDREVAELEDDAEDFELVPVIQFGLHYRFGGGASTAPATPAPAAPLVSPAASATPNPPCCGQAAPARSAPAPVDAPRAPAAAPRTAVAPATRTAAP